TDGSPCTRSDWGTWGDLGKAKHTPFRLTDLPVLRNFWLFRVRNVVLRAVSLRHQKTGKRKIRTPRPRLAAPKKPGVVLARHCGEFAQGGARRRDERVN